jgi:hypothetical protein
MSVTRITPKAEDNPLDNLETELEKQNQPEGSTPSDPSAAGSEARPAWLPEKFKSPEDLAKAYSELEKQFTKQRQESKTTEQQTDPTKTDPASAATKGLDWEIPATEFEEKGTISDETFKRFEAAGIPRDVVSRYAQTRKAEVDAENTKLFERAGGEDVYEVMCDWANNNLPKEDLAAFQKIIQEGEITQALLAVDALKARYVAANGKPPKLISGNSSNRNTTVGYASRAEMVRDMQDARYAKDPAFRKQVEQRIALSAIL